MADDDRKAWEYSTLVHDGKAHKICTWKFFWCDQEAVQAYFCVYTWWDAGGCDAAGQRIPQVMKAADEKKTCQMVWLEANVRDLFQDHSKHHQVSWLLCWPQVPWESLRHSLVEFSRYLYPQEQLTQLYCIASCSQKGWTWHDSGIHSKMARFCSSPETARCYGFAPCVLCLCVFSPVPLVFQLHVPEPRCPIMFPLLFCYAISFIASTCAYSGSSKTLSEWRNTRVNASPVRAITNPY